LISDVGRTFSKNSALISSVPLRLGLGQRADELGNSAGLGWARQNAI